MTEQGPILRAYPLAGEWVRRAACRVIDPNVFFVGKSFKDARAVCARCPVATECFDYATACEELDPYGGHGVWAGLTGRERNRIRTQLKESA